MNKQWQVGILLYNGVDVIDFTGPYEVFTQTAYTEEDSKKILLGTDKKKDHPFLVSTISETEKPVRANHGLTLQPDFSFETAPSFDILVVPGAPLNSLKQAMKNRELSNWVCQQAKKADLVTSVCVGSFILATCRLLDQKKATTHPKAYDYFEQLFPKVTLIRNKRVVADGKFITAGGLTCGIQMALSVVGHLLGNETAKRTANTLLINESNLL